MTTDWIETTVEDLVREGVIERPMDGNHGELHPKASEFVNSGVPFVMASDLTDGRVDFASCAYITNERAASLRKGFSRAGDVLLSHKGTVGRTAIVQELCDGQIVLTPQVTYYRVRDGSRLDHRYLKYYFDSPDFQELLRSWADAGSTRAYLGISAQAELPIDLPPIGEQRAFSEILGALDEKIELNREMNRTLEATARAIFKSWFVDFDPVTTKQQGRPRAFVSEEAWSELPDEFCDSELGAVPAGWPTQPVYGVTSIVYGAPFKSALFNTDSVGRPLIRIRDLQTQTPGVWTPEVHPKGELVVPGDIIVGMDGEFRVELWCGADSWLNQRLCKFVPKPTVPTAFVRFSIEEPIRFFETAKSGTTVVHLGKADIDTIRIVEPTACILRDFKAVADPLTQQVIANKSQSRTLVALRDSLLPKLLSGEIRVRQAEQAVERVL